MDNYLRSLQRLVQAQPDDVECLRRYISALERVASGERLNEMEEISRETSVEVLRNMAQTDKKYHEALEKRIYERINEIRKACQHTFGKPQYGIYIEETCEKCGHSEWY